MAEKESVAQEYMTKIEQYKKTMETVRSHKIALMVKILHCTCTCGACVCVAQVMTIILSGVITVIYNYV